MGTRRRKRKNKTKKRGKRIGGGPLTYPSFYLQKAVNMFSIKAPSAYGNMSNVKPFPYNQSK